MCGRYQFALERCEEIQRIAQEVERRHGKGKWVPGEIRTTVGAPVLSSDSEGIHPELLCRG